MKYLRVISVFVLSCLITDLATAQGAPACCEVPGWVYVVSIEIDNTGQPARSNYQVLLKLNTQLPVSQGKMNADGSDIRFSDSKCGSFINYWIEDSINTAATEIWVLVDSLPADGKEILYMYYGNPDAASMSSFPSVFTNVLIIDSSQTLNGIQSAEWIEIAANATVTASDVTFQARKIILSGGIFGDSLGYGPGAGPGAGHHGNGFDSGGGGAYGGVGGSSGGTTGIGGSIYGTPDGPDIDMGSGGAGSDCIATTAGGGVVRMYAASIELHGAILARGGNAPFCCCLNWSEAAGGGSGGGVLLHADYIEGNAWISAKGGRGGESDTKEGGGGGGGGRIKFFSTFSNTFNGFLNVNGALNGAGHNGWGSQGIPQPGRIGTIARIDMVDYIVVHPENLIRVFPDAGFSYQPCLTPAVFNDLTNIASGSVVNWQWNFGDGQTSNQQSPVHNYAADGVYSVQLITSSDSSCADTFSQQVSIYSTPVAAFSTLNVCLGSPASFTDASTVRLPSVISSWSWDFGDGQTSNLHHPLHNYSAEGIYTVTLIVTTDHNCSDTTTREIAVYPIPVAAFNAANACLGSPIHFNDASTVAAPFTISTWLWDFGDGEISTQQRPAHDYATEGIYTVLLTVTSAGACSHTATQQVEVYAVPVAAFTAEDACLGSPVRFVNASSINAPAAITGWNWNFDDGQTSVQQNPSNNYAGAGSYAVSLMVTTGHCQDTFSHAVNVFPSLTLNLATTDVLCAEAGTGAVDLTVLGGTAAFMYNWSNNATTQNISNLSGGVYSVTVTDAHECVATGSAVIAEPSDSIRLTASVQNVGCFGRDDGSIDLSVSGGTHPYSYDWSNSGAASVNSALPAGTYLVTVTDNHGCTFSGAYTIIEPQQPVLSVVPQDTTFSYGMPLQFSSTLTPADANAQYTWSPTSYLSCADCPHPQMTAHDSITYYIAAENSGGCFSYDTVRIQVLFEKVLYIPNAFTPNGDGVNDVFYIYTYGDKRIRMNIFDRWGSLIFTSDNKEHGWDGTAHGQQVNPGVFVYDTFIEYLDHTTERRHGSVTVIK